MEKNMTCEDYGMKNESSVAYGKTTSSGAFTHTLPEYMVGTSLSDLGQHTHNKEHYEMLNKIKGLESTVDELKQVIKTLSKLIK